MYALLILAGCADIYFAPFNLLTLQREYICWICDFGHNLHRLGVSILKEVSFQCLMLSVDIFPVYYNICDRIYL